MVKIGGVSRSKISKKKEDILEEQRESSSKNKNLNPFEQWGVKMEVTPVVEDTEVYEGNKNLSTSILDKYFPTGDGELIGLDGSYWNLKQWWENKLEDNKEGLPFLLFGNTGSGKTCLYKYFVKQQNVNFFLYNSFFGLMSKKDCMFKFKSFLQSGKKDTSEFFSLLNLNAGPTKEVLLVIDEVQNILNDSISSTDLIDLLILSTGETKKTKFKGKLIWELFLKSKKGAGIERLPKFKILLISSDGLGNKLQEIKKYCWPHWIPTIPLTESKPWLAKICKKEKIKASSPVLEKIVKFCKNDKRLMLNTLSYLGIDSKISIKTIDTVLKCLKKDEDISVWNFTERLFDDIEPPTADEIENAWSTDGYILESMMWENYVDYGDDLERLSQVADSLSISDCYHNNLYTGNGYESITHCWMGLMREHYHARTDSKKNRCKLRSSYINTAWHSQIIHQKNLDQLRSVVFDVTLDEINFIKYFIQNLIANDSKSLSINEEKVLTYIFGRGWDIEHLERMHKHWNINNKKRVRGFSQKVINKLNSVKK